MTVAPAFDEMAALLDLNEFERIAARDILTGLDTTTSSDERMRLYGDLGALLEHRVNEWL